MNENQPSNTPAPGWRELRREEREQRRAERRTWRGNNAWIIGAVLIAVGFLLLPQNLEMYTLHNWWAAFILIPAAGSFAAAWRIFDSNGSQFSPAVIGPLFMGLVFLALTGTLLFELSLDWGLIGPIGSPPI